MSFTTNPIIDVWMQHPNLKFINHDMFASLRRWMGIGFDAQKN